jgi:hypothetical protein
MKKLKNTLTLHDQHRPKLSFIHYLLIHPCRPLTFPPDVVHEAH